MMGLIYWLLHTLSNVKYYLIHAFLAFYYRGKKQVVPPIRNPLLFKSACKLAEEIRDGKIKSEEVVQAYIDRILEVEPYLNAVVQDRFHEAVEEAKEVDKTVKEIANSGTNAKKQLADEKPFFGVPFTIKLLIKVKGLPCSGGCKLFENQIADEDAPCVALIKKAGGIILANTNAPEFGVSMECYNLLYGKTCNPYDTTRTPGGSSGGESALLGAGASVVGIGNDFVGSVRVPSHFTGVFAHKSSMGLVNSTGTFPLPHPDQKTFVYSGPMCRYTEDIVAMMKLLTEGNPMSQKFGQKVNFRKLKIYYSTHMIDMKIPPVEKEIASSLHKAVSYFTNKYGVEAKEINNPLFNQSAEMTLHFISNPIKNLIHYVSLGKMDNANVPMEMLRVLIGRSTFSFSSMVFALVKIFPSFVLRENDIAYYASLCAKMKKDLDELLDEDSLFFFPTYPVVAPYHYEMSTSLAISFAFTGMLNFTGHPATQCPLGFNEEGLPYGMQIIGGMNNDPLTVACAVELEKVFGGWIPPK